MYGWTTESVERLKVFENLLHFRQLPGIRHSDIFSNAGDGEVAGAPNRPN